jgi:Family of unknown function (DUF6326)
MKMMEVDMHNIKERLSLFWLFALLNYLYADCTALFAIVGSPNLSDAPHFPPWVLLASSVFMEIPIAMIVACRLLPFRANRLANIIAGAIVTLINARSSCVLVLRDDRNCMHLGHRLAGVDLVRG